MFRCLLTRWSDRRFVEDVQRQAGGGTKKAPRASGSAKPGKLVQKQRQAAATDDLAILADFGVKTVDAATKSPQPMSPSGLSDFASSPDRDASLSPTAGGASAVGSFAARNNGRLAADAPSGSDQKFMSRKDKRKVEQAFPAGSADASKHAKSTGTPPTFEAIGSHTTKTDRHMFDTMQAQAKALRARTESLGNAIITDHKMSQPDEEDPLALTQETVTVVGRVCMERGAPKLTQQSAGIECVWNSEYGEHSERARLDVHQLPKFSLFPGQIVAVQGVITQSRGGEKIVKASRIVEGSPLPIADRRTLSGPGVSAVVAAGPYTTKDSLQYVPLAELLASAAEEKPDLLILCGPFVDVNQSGITDSRLVELTHQEVFYERIVAQVNKFCLSGSPGTRVVMVPSERDVHHDFVFPQPPFSIPRDERGTAEFEIHGNISFARNPTTIRCKGVDFGVASIDVLKYMNIATVSNQQAFKEPGRRVAVRAEQCLLQRSYMPIFPPPHNLPLDVSRLAQVEMPTTPHVLLVPSDLKFMAKPVLDGQVMLINPCRLCKGEAAGTFARVFVPTGEAAAAPLPPKSAAVATDEVEVKMEDAADSDKEPKADATADDDKAKADVKPEAEAAAAPAAAVKIEAESTELDMVCDIQVEIVRV